MITNTELLPITNNSVKVVIKFNKKKLLYTYKPNENTEPTTDKIKNEN